MPHAVADGKIVSAPGSAPGTFAVEFLKALHPDQPGKIAGMCRIARFREYNRRRRRRLHAANLKGGLP